MHNKDTSVGAKTQDVVTQLLGDEEDYEDGGDVEGAT